MVCTDFCKLANTHHLRNGSKGSSLADTLPIGLDGLFSFSTYYSILSFLKVLPIILFILPIIHFIVPIILIKSEQELVQKKQ